MFRLALLIFAFALDALCSGIAVADSTRPLTIGFAAANLQSDIFNQIRIAAERQAREMGAATVVVDAEDDGERQADQVQDLVDKKIQALILIPAGASPAALPVMIAKGAGVPVVTVDRNPSRAPGDSFITTDSMAGADELGAYACQVTGGKAQLEVIESRPHTRHEDDRNKGFAAALAKCPGITEVYRDWTNQSLVKEGFVVTQRALASDTDISLILGRVDSLALGAARAVQAAHLDHKVVVIGFDGDSDGLQAVREGVLDATMTQRTGLIGRLAVRSALDLIAGKPVPAQQVEGAILTTKDNVDRIIADHP